MSTDNQYGINILCIPTRDPQSKHPTPCPLQIFHFLLNSHSTVTGERKPKKTRIVQLSKNILAPASRQNYTPPLELCTAH